jgi:site-specific DNA-methyltransferase (adenine-specific)
MTTSHRYLIGDSLRVLRTLPAKSVDLVVTSPPFLGLRKYKTDDDPDEMGSEGSPAEFVDRLLDVIEELARVLAPHGSLVIELGDSSSMSGGPGGDYRDRDEIHDRGFLREGQPKFVGSAKKASAMTKALGRTGEVPRNDGRGGSGWPMAKSLCMIPESVRWALAYGRNPFNGRTTDPWIIRNVVSWIRTNPPPGQLHDKYRRGTTTLLVATKSKDRWFDDYDARTAPSPNSHARTRKGVESRKSTGKSVDEGRGGGWSTLDTIHSTTSAPPLDWWLIPSRTYRSKVGKHYAAFPERLVETPILTMCPQQVCVHCGTPRRRITTPTADYATKLGTSIYPKHEGDPTRQLTGKAGAHSKDIVRDHVTVGWTTCPCTDSLLGASWRNGVVLDPFAGTGTVAAVARRLDRDSIGIDFNPANALIATERIEDLTVETPDTPLESAS